MQPLTADEIRASFVNCSKGDAKRAILPRDLATTRWDDLDFLGWEDPAGSDRVYLVAPYSDSVAGIMLRQSKGPKQPRRNMCQLCLTPHNSEGVRLTVAPRVGESGKKGNTVGLYLCTDMACSLYVRNKKKTTLARLNETITEEEAIARLQESLVTFIDRVHGR